MITLIAISTRVRINIDMNIDINVSKNLNIGWNHAKIGPILMKMCPQGDPDARDSNLQSDLYVQFFNLGLFFQFLIFNF